MNVANFIQAARGPLLLITLGLLMVIDYNTPFTFTRTWPALIIVFGLLKLLERMAAPPQPVVYPPPMPAPYVPQPSAYQGPASYQGSAYQPAPGYQPPVPPPPSNFGGTPQGGTPQ